MIVQQRLRSAAAFLAGLFVVFGVAWAGEAFAASTVSITSPVAGDTVSGDILVEGSLAGEGDVVLTVALTEQVLGDCGSTVVERTVPAVAGEAFSVALATASLVPGEYCAVVVVDDGRLSAAIGDVRVEPSFASDGGVQLPTLELPGDNPITAAPPAVPGVEVLLPTALGAIAAVSVVVLSVGLAVRRRRLQDI